jgi:hypothetical protein
VRASCRVWPATDQRGGPRLPLRTASTTLRMESTTICGCSLWIISLFKWRSDTVARRRMEMPAAKKSRKEPDEAVSTSTVFETGRYLLQVDKQTKGFFPTPEAAHSAGLKIKSGAVPPKDSW